MKGAGTRAVATPAPRRHLTLAQDHTLRLRANTGGRHARAPPPSHTRSFSRTSPAPEHPKSPRPCPVATLHSFTLRRFVRARPPEVATPVPRRNFTLAHSFAGASRCHAPRSRGSRTSRSASPSRFEPNTARLIALPGKSTRWGAFCAYSAAETESIRAHDGYGSGTPSPRNDSVASTRMALPSWAVQRTMNG